MESSVILNNHISIHHYRSKHTKNNFFYFAIDKLNFVSTFGKIKNT